MSDHRFDDETLMAYADGEADAETSARIEAAMAGDEALAERIALLADARRTVKAAFAADLETPVPNALEAAIRRAGEQNSNVVPLRPRSYWPTALAASLALAVGIGAGWLARTGSEAGHGMHFAGLEHPELAGHLASTPSGGDITLGDGARLRLVASFVDGAGRFCRELEHDGTDGQTLVAVTCREGADWALVFAVAAGATGGYAPASSLDTLDTWLASIDAGPPLDMAAEADRLRTLANP